jgi:hypothetical protein
VNFTFDTIAPVRELVIVIPDLYLPRELRGTSPKAGAFANVPGIERVARFGTRQSLPGGWRAWLPGRVGRPELADVAPACIAAAGLDASPAPSAPGTHAASTRWIATAVHLQAGLTRVHLDHRGLLRLAAGEQATLATDFGRTFGSTNCTLSPLPGGEFLLDTPGLPALATSEPARCAGGELDQLMPTGSAAAPLRRLLSEIEMWLHTQTLNEVRSKRGEAPLTALWPWGALGRIVRPEPHAQPEMPLAFGEDAWLAGLWRLQGCTGRAPPECFNEVLAAGARESVLLVGVGGQLRSERETAADALARLDERFVLPALQAVHGGVLAGLTLILNDALVQVHRASLRRFWRRAVSGLTGFA